MRINAVWGEKYLEQILDGYRNMRRCCLIDMKSTKAEVRLSFIATHFLKVISISHFAL